MPEEQNQPSSSTPTILWSFLRRKDAPSLQIPSSDTYLAPLAPIDRTGTSMRMVLLDTQANLEKFGEHVSKLVSGVEETRGKMDLTSRLWEVERERLGEEMVNLVNRCQSSLQNSLDGHTNILEDLRRESSLLEKRLDECYMLQQAQHQAQTHAVQNLTQAVQLQAQMLQSLQEQQGTIIAAVAPLLPLLQAIPSQLDNAITKAALSLPRQPPLHDASGSSPKSENNAATPSALSGQAPPAGQVAFFDSSAAEIASLASHSLLTSLKKRTRSPSPITAEPVSSPLAAGPVLKKRIRKRSLNGWNLDNSAAPQDCGISPLSTSLSLEDRPPNRAPSPSQTKPDNVELGVDPLDADLFILDSPPPHLRTPAASTPSLSALRAISNHGASHLCLPATTLSIPIVDDSEFWKAGKRFIQLDGESDEEG